MQLAGRVGVGVEAAPWPDRGPCAERDQPLLRAVVQVALDAAPLGLGAVDRGGAARIQLLDPGLELVAPWAQAEQMTTGEGAEVPHRDRRPGREQHDAHQPERGERDRGAAGADFEHAELRRCRPEATST